MTKEYLTVLTIATALSVLCMGEASYALKSCASELTQADKDALKGFLKLFLHIPNITILEILFLIRHFIMNVWKPMILTQKHVITAVVDLIVDHIGAIPISRFGLVMIVERNARKLWQLML